MIQVSWYFVYAASGQKLSVYLRCASGMRMFNLVTGGVFLGFVLLMDTARR